MKKPAKPDQAATGPMDDSTLDNLLGSEYEAYKDSVVVPPTPVLPLRPVLSQAPRSVRPPLSVQSSQSGQGREPRHTRRPAWLAAACVALVLLPLNAVAQLSREEKPLMGEIILRVATDQRAIQAGEQFTKLLQSGLSEHFGAKNNALIDKE